MAIDAAIITPATSIQLIPTVSATSYASGNIVGGLLTFTGSARSNYPFAAGLIQSATATFRSGVTPALDLIVFSSMPAGTYTDNTALAVPVGDLADVVGVIHLTDATVLGSTSIMQSQQQAMPFVCVGSTTLYGVVVMRATATLASTSDMTLTVQILQD